MPGQADVDSLPAGGSDRERTGRRLNRIVKVAAGLVVFGLFLAWGAFGPFLQPISDAVSTVEGDSVDVSSGSVIAGAIIFLIGLAVLIVFGPIAAIYARGTRRRTAWSSHGWPPPQVNREP